MGACLSCRSYSTFKNVRVVHLNGYVEDFEQPISASQVIGNLPKHFVCTSIQLLSSSSKPLKGDTQLQPGQVYFMLPYSILQDDVSPVDLACLAKRLTAIAKTRNMSLKASPLSLSSQTVWCSPSRSPGRVGVSEQIGINMMNGGRSPCRVQPWKPILDTIREKSFNRRSESDLHSMSGNLSKGVMSSSIAEFTVLKLLHIIGHSSKALTIKQVNWFPPVCGWVKCNSDGAAKGSPGWLLLEVSSEIVMLLFLVASPPLLAYLIPFMLRLLQP